MVYVVVGGSKGIGKCTVDILKQQGHTVLDVSRHGPDVQADIGTAEGRAYAIRRIHELFPDGIDGLVSNAAIPGGFDGQSVGKVISVNYYGNVAMVVGLLDLLEKKQGNCVVTVSSSVSYYSRTAVNIDMLMSTCDDEQRVCAFAEELAKQGKLGNTYLDTKYALCRWVKRMAPSLAVRGVILNAVAPGGVDTDIIPGKKTNPLFETATMGFAMPTVYAQRDLMKPETVADTMAFMVSPAARGCCGAILYCDGGTNSLLHSEIYL